MSNFQCNLPKAYFSKIILSPELHSLINYAKTLKRAKAGCYKSLEYSVFTYFNYSLQVSMSFSIV